LFRKSENFEKFAEKPALTLILSPEERGKLSAL